MKFLLFSLLATVPATLAASCSDAHTYGEEYYWEMRQQMCANEQCGYQKECTLKKYNGIGLTLSLTRQNRGSKTGFPNCWAATENIITQCIRNGKGTGVWETGEEYYKFLSRVP